MGGERREGEGRKEEREGRDRGGRGQCCPPQTKAPQNYFPGAGAGLQQLQSSKEHSEFVSKARRVW